MQKKHARCPTAHAAGTFTLLYFAFDFPRGIDDTDVHCVGMQGDAAVEWVLLVKFHHASPGLGVKRSQQHFFSLWLQTSATNEFSGIDLIGETASPGEAMMSIKAMHTEPPISRFLKSM